MMARRCVILLVVWVLLAGCGGGDGEGAEAGHLELALGMVPADSSRLYFTDWELLKAYEGFPELSSERPMDERMSFMKAFIGDVATEVLPRQAVISGYGYNRFLTHAEIWSWDSTDLVWEVSLERGSAPPAYVLQLREDFDFGPLQALFEERGFERSERQGVTIFSHDMDLEQEWIRKSEFGILNTALLEDERRLVLSSALEGVQAIVDVIKGEGRSLAENPAAAATAERLGEMATAFLSVGPAACVSSGDPLQLWISQGMDEEQLAQMRRLVEEGPSVHAYSGLGLGYRYEQERPLGLIVMHYARAEEAEGDLETRRRLAEEGSSLSFERTLREAVFTLDGAAVEGSDLVLRVRPVDDVPRRLLELVFRQDMVFAGCP